MLSGDFLKLVGEMIFRIECFGDCVKSFADPTKVGELLATLSEISEQNVTALVGSEEASLVLKFTFLNEAGLSPLTRKLLNRTALCESTLCWFESLVGEAKELMFRMEEEME